MFIHFYTYNALLKPNAIYNGSDIIVEHKKFVRILKYRIKTPKRRTKLILFTSTYLKFFLYIRNDAGIPMTKGVGANKSCSAQLIQVGKSGMTKIKNNNDYLGIMLCKW